MKWKPEYGVLIPPICNCMEDIRNSDNWIRDSLSGKFPKCSKCKGDFCLTCGFHDKKLCWQCKARNELFTRLESLVECMEYLREAMAKGDGEFYNALEDVVEVQAKIRKGR